MYWVKGRLLTFGQSFGSAACFGSVHFEFSVDVAAVGLALPGSCIISYQCAGGGGGWPCKSTNASVCPWSGWVCVNSIRVSLFCAQRVDRIVGVEVFFWDGAQKPRSWATGWMCRGIPPLADVGGVLNNQWDARSFQGRLLTELPLLWKELMEDEWKS